MSNNPPDELTKREWHLNSLRFTFFARAPIQSAGSTLFDDFFEISADAETHRKAEFRSEFTAQKGSVVYQAVIVGTKVDFMVDVGAAPDNPISGFPFLPDEGEFITLFQASCLRLITNQADTIKRVAVGAHFVSLVADKSEGYRVLPIYVKGLNLDDSSSDFQYRINRPRNIQVEASSVRVNRLSTWGCMTHRIALLAEGAAEQTTTLGCAISVQTDVNTSPELDFSTLPPNIRSELISKLFEFTKEIPEKGDVS